MLRLVPLKVYEHVGWIDQHSANVWWHYDARETSPKTCDLCQWMNDSPFRGDEVETQFPYHIHLTPNTIKPMVHLHCRCRLLYAGTTEDVQEHPIGWTRRPKIDIKKWYNLPASARREARRVMGSPFQRGRIK